MRSNKLYAGLVVGIALAAMAGCAKAPSEQITATEAALKQAEALAPTFAPEQWQAANEALIAARTEIETQDGKMGLFRSYDTAEQLLAQATEKAQAAGQAAITAQEEARAEAQSAITAVQETLSAATAKLEELAATRKQPKGFANDLALMRQSLEGLSGQVPAIQEVLATGDFLGARSQAEALEAQVQTLLTDLDGAMAKLSAR